MGSTAVSVIIPCYNAEKYLDQCMDSILNQTLQNIEIICVDDGSADSTPDKLHHYAEMDARVRVFSQKNLFAGTARNLGLSHARGEYLLFLDCDDFFEENLARDAYTAAVSNDADVVLFNARCFDEATGEFRKGWFLNMGLVPEKQPFSPDDCPDHLYQITTPVPWTKMFRRQFLLDKQLQFQTLRHTNDFYFVQSALAMAKRIVALDETLVTYRIGQKTNLQSTKNKSPLCFYTAYKVLRDKLEEQGILDALHRSYANRVLGGCLYNLRTMNDPESQKNVFDRLREEIFQKLDLPDHDVSFYYIESDYHEMRLIKNGTFEQYLEFRTSEHIRKLWHSIERETRAVRSHTLGSRQYEAALVSAVERIVGALKEAGQNAKCAYEMAHHAFNREVFSAAELKMFSNAQLYQEFSMIQQHDYATMQDMLKRRLVVSLTSYPGRIHSMAPVLESLYNQERKADEIILWLAEGEFPERGASLPEYLTALADQKKLTIRWCDNLKPHKKYFYAIQEYPEDIIVTVDDDLLYSPKLLSSLYRSYLQHPKAVSAVRVHLMMFSADGKILPYNTWIRETDCCLYTPSMQLFATGGAGTLYPPHLFRKEFFDKEAIAENSPLADDLWLKAMEVISGVPVVAARRREALVYLPDTQTDALKVVNDEQQQNDVQLSNIIRWTDETFGKGTLLDTLMNPDLFHPILGMETVGYHLDQERRYFRQQLAATQKREIQTKSSLQQAQALAAQKEAKLKDADIKLKSTEAKLNNTEKTLKDKEAELLGTKATLKSTEAMLRNTEETLRNKEVALRNKEVALLSMEAMLKSTEATLEATGTKLKDTEAERAALEARLKATQNSLRCAEESKPIGRQLKAVGLILAKQRAAGANPLSLGFKYLIYGLAWIPEKLLAGAMFYLKNGGKQTVKKLFGRISGEK